jgi:ABC-type amino acid transport substrate-binding protein
MTSTLRSLLGLALALQAAGSVAGDLPEIRKSGVLRVLVVDGSPSFFKVEGAGEPGLDREVLDGFARLHGLRVGVVEAPSWSALVPWLLAGRGDVLAGGVTEALREGRITATLSGIEDALLYQRGDPRIQIGGFMGPPGSLAFGVRKDAPQLKRALDQYIANLRRTPTWGRLVVKYFGDSAPELLRRARGE